MRRKQRPIVVQSNFHEVDKSAFADRIMELFGDEILARLREMKAPLIEEDRLKEATGGIRWPHKPPRD